MRKIDISREASIEKYLLEQVESIGGIARKWDSPGHRGVPDRICIFPVNNIYFVELKSPRGKLSKLQTLEIAQLRSLGCRVYVINSFTSVDTFMGIVNSETQPMEDA